MATTTYIIAKASYESLLISKEGWETAPDPSLEVIKEFEAPDWETAKRIYEKEINI